MNAAKKPLPPFMMKKGEGKKPPMKYAKGGAIDGCATKGKTKGTMIKMKSGGKC